MAQVQLLSQELTNEHISMPYPHVKVLDPSDALALILQSLPKGDLPVLCEYKGQCRQLAKIKLSAPVLLHLSKVSSITYCKEVSDAVKLVTVDDIMGVLI